MKNRIYFIDDEPHIRDSVSQALMIEGIDVICYPNAVEALKQIDTQHAAIVVTDIHMPVMNGLVFLKELRSRNPHFQVIVLTGYGDVKTAVTAMKEGAYDFLEKPFTTDSLMKAIRNAEDKLALLQENIWLKKELDMQTHAGSKLIGHSQAMVQIRRALISAQTDRPLILLGDKGTGKRLCAQFFYDIHNRNEGELVPISGFYFSDLSPEEMVNRLAELLAQHANDTLFIHDAEVLKPKQWQTLLETPLGSGKLVCATVALPHALQGEVQKVVLPTLDQRKNDIPALYKHFVRNACSRYQVQPPRITAEELETVQQQTWPENIRQLRQFAELRALKSPQFLSADVNELQQAQAQTMTQRLDYFEYTLLFDALKRHGGRLKEVQQELQVSRKTLYDKLKKHQLDKSQFKDQ
ncbi:TPA: response regulator [Vibrio vulnificus]|uniref:sigma-54-dependent transcriptional regulator n=1 Tax=Vibrio sp. 05-20-BW147 TaxID=2575834 RepID=UPI0015932106|nr:response regulator [Vibrio sp. 05-20-BW147]NVC62636.1 sigma-54-dependent Fis family transcriptional regulator [Vibrio sp. 05-20-BW147]HAS6346457.1 response regulator [Vibrio vulnificus]